VAATDHAATPARALLAAALALPGIVPATVAAQTMPDAGFIQFKYLDYRDWQPGARRMRVENPGLYVMSPFAESWVVEGALVYDGMSGASPRWHNTLSGASGEGIHDRRAAGDAKVTRYFERFSVGAGVAYSHENDYISRGGSIDVRFWTADKNRTFAFSYAGAADRIDTPDGAAVQERKYVNDFLFGVTQVLSQTAIVQSNLTYTRGHGYYDDPYKLFDSRPDNRRVLAWLTRLNQHYPESGGTLQLAYRYIDDSWDANSHMIEAAWVQPLPHAFSVRPNLRYYTQRAAYFYFDPPFPTGLVFGQPYTADTRLSAFGAFTLGLLLAKDFGDGWSGDLKVEYYRQKSDWRAGGNGSPDILPFSARWIQVGVGKSF
jgi:hypothetical protein